MKVKAMLIGALRRGQVKAMIRRMANGLENWEIGEFGVWYNRLYLFP